MTVSELQHAWNKAEDILKGYDESSIDELVSVCEYNQEFIEFLSSKEKGLSFFVKNKIVYITQNNSLEHVSAQTLITHDIQSKINSESKSTTYIVLGGSVLVANIYSCGVAQEKYYDGAIILGRNGHFPVNKNPELVIEVSYKHESLSDLFLECSHYLTSFVDTCTYSLGFYINPYRSSFHLTVFILKRKMHPDENDVSKITNIYKNRGSLDECHLTQEKIAFPLSNEYCSKNFNVLLHFYGVFTSEDILNGASISFSLDGQVFNADRDIELEISNIHLLDIYRIWQQNNRR